MHAHETQPATPQPHTSAPKANPFAPLPFETAGFGQEMGGFATNPFPRRPHEVDMGTTTVSLKTAEPTTRLEPEAKLGKPGWPQFSFYAPDRPAPAISPQTQVQRQEESGDEETEEIQGKSLGESIDSSIQRQAEPEDESAPLEQSDREEGSEEIQAKSIDSQPVVQRQAEPEDESAPLEQSDREEGSEEIQAKSIDSQPVVQRQAESEDESAPLEQSDHEEGSEEIQAKSIDSQPAPANSAPQPNFSPTLPQRPPTWMWQPYVPPQPVSQEPQPEVETKPAESDWLKFDLYAAGQTPPNLPRRAGVQAKLSIGRPNDAYEQEADRVAAEVMAMPETAPQVQRQTEEEEEIQAKPLVQRQVEEEAPEEEEIQSKPLSETITPLVQRQVEEEATEEEEIQSKPLAETITPLVQRQTDPEALDEEVEVQPKPLMATIAPLVQRQEQEEEEIQVKAGGSEPLTAGATLEQQLSQQQGKGSPLSEEVRSFMEPRFGTDFSGVRVHTGAESVQMNRAVGAKAFAYKQDIYYGAGESPRSDELTAHELTHVVQQTGRVQNKIQPVTFQPLPRLAREFNQQQITERQTDNKALPTVQMKCAACGGEEEQIQPKSISSTVTAQPNKTLQKLPSWNDVKNTASTGAQWVGDKAGQAADMGKAGAQWVGDKAGQAADMGKDAFASLVARVAPGLSDLIRQGPVGLLTEKIKDGLKGWLSGIVSGANIGDVVATLKGSFAQVFAGVQGLGKGDPASCAAFADSVQKLRDLGQAFMDNPVVKQVQTAFTKVSSVFQQVTSAIVAPVFDTLMNVAGGVFSAVKGFATTIWEWGAPVRSTLGAAWDWVKEQLGIGGDGSEGILGWLKTKASDAWTSIKTTFAPVIEPLKKVGLVMLAFSPVGLFAAIAKFGPKLLQMAEWLWKHKGDKNLVRTEHKEMGTVLPDLLIAIQGFSQDIQSTVTSLVSQVTQLSQSVLGLLGAISGVPLLSMAQGLVQSLSEELQRLVSWGQESFETVAKSVQETFAKIKAKIEPYIGVLSSLAMAIVNPGMIPVILAGSAWQLLDDCYKAPIIDFLLDVVIGILQAAPTLPMFGLLWPMLKAGVLGFLQGVKAQPAATKVAVTNKLAKIISGGSPAFLLGFAKGLLKGIWEGLTDPFVLMYEGLKGLGNLTVWLNDTASAALSPATAAPVAAGNPAPAPAAADAAGNQPQNAEMGQRMHQMAGELQPPVDQVAQGFMPAVQAAFSGGEGLTFEQLMQKLGDAWSAVEGAIQGAGSTLASKACEFMMQDGAEGEMGETVGWLAGTIAFEVALAALTAGGATAAKGAMKVLQTFAKILDWTGEALGLAFKALAKVGGYVLDAVKGIGKLLSKAGGAAKTLLDALATIGRKLIAFADELLGLSKKVGKGAAGEVAEEAAEKTAKEAAEAGAEKTAKEAAEAGAEKGAKEVAEAGAEKSAKEGVEVLSETTIKVGQAEHTVTVLQRNGKIELIMCSVCQKMTNSLDRILKEIPATQQTKNFRRRFEALQAKIQDLENKLISRKLSQSEATHQIKNIAGDLDRICKNYGIDDIGNFARAQEQVTNFTELALRSKVSSPVDAEITMQLMESLFAGGTDKKSLKQFVSALENGMAASAKGAAGIKQLIGTVRGFTHELKILGAGERLLGKQQGKTIVFTELSKHL